VDVADYGEIEQRLHARTEEYTHIVILWEAIAEVWGLQYKLLLMSEDERTQLRKVMTDKFARILSEIAPNKICICNKVTSKYFMHEPEAEASMCNFMNDVNRELSHKVSRRVYWIDSNAIIMELSPSKAVNARDYYRSRMLHSYEYAYLFSEIAVKYICISIGMQKKLLILDCDNTLWGGLCGELEADVILDGVDAPGVIYRECQGIVKYLANNGIAVALCSKNNSEDVWKVFKNNSSMLLKETDVVANRINWSDKVENIISIANELHLSLESIVFVDDSEHELENVRLRLPGVEVVKVPENIYDYPYVMRKVAAKFYLEGVSKEDGARTKYYLEESKRKKEANSHASYEDYLASLEQTMKIECNNYDNLQRIHQLFEKTNQFNATTKRYTSDELKTFISDHRSDLYSFSMADKYGDMGLVGTALIIKADDGRSARLDSFIMSCRVIGKCAEYTFIKYIANRLRKAGYQELIIEYRRTQKNDIVHKMLVEYAGLEGTSTDGKILWYIALDNQKVTEKVDYVRIILDT